MQFGWVQTHIQFSVVSRPKFTGLFSWNAGGIAGDHMPFRFWISSVLKSEVVWNRAEFCMFLAPNFFGGRAPEFLDLYYKEHPHCYHVAKFRGDRPTELGGSPANKKRKKTSRVKHKAFGTNVPGGLIISIKLLTSSVSWGAGSPPSSRMSDRPPIYSRGCPSPATLFRWSWKILSYFVANLSKTLHINFYQNRSSIVESTIKKFGVFFYASQCIFVNRQHRAISLRPLGFVVNF